MKPTLLLVIFSLNCLSQTLTKSQLDSIWKTHNESRRGAIGKPLPDFQIIENNGTLSNKKLSGKTVFINFWFSACKPCMEEIPQLNELYSRYKTDTNVVFLSFTFDSKEKASKTIIDKGMNFPAYSIPANLCSALNPGRQYPANMVVNRKGIIIFYETGLVTPKWNRNRHFRKKLARIINKSLRS